MSLPNSAELSALRKGLRKQKLPKVFDGMWGSEPGIGSVKFVADANDFKVEWVSFDVDVKSDLKEASWQRLCTDPALELQRLEIGTIFSQLLEIHAQKVMDSIGHPITAFEEAEPYRAEAKRWKHWALVPAGHMLDIK